MRIIVLPIYIAVVIHLLQRGAAALDIQFNYDDDFAARPGAVAGMERAARMWQAVLDDPVTVVIDVDEVPIGELGFSQAGTYRTPHIASYTEVRDALIQDAISSDDATSINHLPLGPKLVFRTVDPNGNVLIDDTGRDYNGYLDLPLANAKALGMTVDQPPGTFDAEVDWNTAFLDTGILDRDRTDGIRGTDFVSVAVHEIGHALGFLSGADDFDEESLPNGPFGPEDLSIFAILNVPDLFRYKPESLPHIDVTPGGDPYFSIDGGATRLADFANGIYHGDGFQAGHWQEAAPPDEVGIMDASLADGVAYAFSQLDLTAMDVIGWDVSLPLAGDYNASRRVEQADLDFVLLGWGDDATALPNDWLLDLPTGTIDQEELDAVLLGWGNSTATHPAVTAVPELSTRLLLTMTVLVGLACRACAGC